MASKSASSTSRYAPLAVHAESALSTAISLHPALSWAAASAEPRRTGLVRFDGHRNTETGVH